MHVFLMGPCWSNAGPANVNRALIEQSKGNLLYLKHKNKLLRIIETFFNSMKADVIVVSSGHTPLLYKIYHSFNKKIVYLVHGDIEFESRINHMNTSLERLAVKDKLLAESRIIIGVSEKFSEWLKTRYPQYVSKITFVNNGIDLSQRPKSVKEKYSVAVAGGNRTIKNNADVCRAVKIIQDGGIDCKLYVFGRHYDDCEELPEIQGAEFQGQMDKEKYYNKLDKIDVFVMNSEIESFGLTAADALNCNCSLLMSKNIGAMSIMRCEPCDIIDNNHDPYEIAEKIIYLSDHPNSDRLYKSVDLDTTSIEYAYKKLMHICETVFHEN